MDNQKENNKTNEEDLVLRADEKMPKRKTRKKPSKGVRRIRIKKIRKPKRRR